MCGPPRAPLPADAVSMRAIVAGAGIGGLTATLALRRAGWDVTVLERDAEPRAVGAGLMVGANAVACLEALGLGEGLRRIGRPVPAGLVTTHTGRVLQALDVAALGLSSAGVTVDRGALHSLLLGAVGDVRCGADVASVEDGALLLADGTRMEADRIVGADGLYSAVRRRLDPGVNVVYSGQTCWRLLAPDPLRLPGPVERWGPGVRVGWTPLGDGVIYAYLVTDAPPETFREPTTKAALLERFAPFGDEARAVIGAAERWVHHDISELDRHCWGRGRVVLIGDAAHGMTPNLGQGAAMAIEDAVTLPRVLGVEDPAAALEAARAPRVGPMARTSRWVGRISHWRSPVACAVRDALMAWTPAFAARKPLAGLLLGGPVAVG